MPVIIDQELAKRLERSEAKRMTAIALQQAADQPEEGTRAAWIGGSAAVCVINREKGAYGSLNCAQAVGFTASREEAREQLDGIEAFYRELELPPQLDLSPFADREFVKEVWERGYKPRSFTTVYAADLRELAARGLLEEREGSRMDIQPIGAEDAPQYSRLITEAVGSKSTNFFAPFVRFPGVSAYIALVNGEPAAAAAMNAEDGVCGLYLGATLPRFRNNGCQSALTRARLREGLEQGCDLAMVLTDPGSTSGRNMERAGFQVAYTRVTVGR